MKTKQKGSERRKQSIRASRRKEYERGVKLEEMYGERLRSVEGCLGILDEMVSANNAGPAHPEFLDVDGRYHNLVNRLTSSQRTEYQTQYEAIMNKIPPLKPEFVPHSASQPYDPASSDERIPHAHKHTDVKI